MKSIKQTLVHTMWMHLYVCLVLQAAHFVQDLIPALLIITGHSGFAS